MRKRVLITEDIHNTLAEQLTKAGYACTHLKSITYAKLLQTIPHFHGLVVRSKVQVDQHIIDAGNQLLFIGRTGSGMEHIDVTYAQSKGIICLNSPEGNKDAVAEQAVGMLLALCHQIVKSDAELRTRWWNRKANRGTELQGKTVGIIGFGNTGSAFAQRLQGFDVSVLAYDKYKSDYGTAAVKEASLPEIFEAADVLSIHLPLNSETQHLINTSFLEQFNKPIYFINTSRGGIVHTLDVLKQLEKGKLLGIGLDVFENEDLHSFTDNDWTWFEQLSTHKKVVITPHTAGLSGASRVKIADILAKKIIQLALTT